MNISPTIVKAVSRGLLQLQKHSPTILTGAGVVALLGAGVLAAKSTLKLEETLNKGELAMLEAKEGVHSGELEQIAVTKTLVKNVGQIVRLYWLPTTVAVGGVVLTLTGQHILHQRNAALVVAYTGLETALRSYRERVVEKYGADVDQELRYGLETKSIVGPDGKKEKVTAVSNLEQLSEYVFIFDKENENWVSNYEHNMFFLRGHQNIFNDLLESRKHLMLSEVLDGLGFDRTPASIVTGWLYKPGDETRDNVVDFGIKDMGEFIILDFNVDGTVFDKI